MASPRGFAKSTITDLFLLAWSVLTGKKHFAILISDTYTQATSFLEGFKNEIENNEIIRWLYPNALGDLWSNDRLILNGWNNKEHKYEPVCVLCKGAGMKIRGLKFLNYRPDLILIDDLENDEMVQNQDRRIKTKHWLLRAVIPALAKDGDIVMIGTILHFDSVLKNIIDHKDEFASWNTVLYRAIQDDGTSLWPELYSVEELQRMRSDPTHPKYVGELTFSQEYQNKPIDENQRIFKEEWTMNRFRLAEKQNEYRIANPKITTDWVHDYFKKIVIAVDPAITESNYADFTAFSSIGIAKTDGHIWVLDYFQKRINDPVVQANEIINFYLQWQADNVKIEAVAYQMGLYQLVKRISAEKNIYVPCTAFKPDKDKVRRAIIHSALLSGGLVHLREDHPLFGTFLAEMLEFPLSAHDDMVDAFMSASEEVVMQSRPRVFTEKPKGF